MLTFQAFTTYTYVRENGGRGELVQMNRDNERYEDLEMRRRSRIRRQKRMKRQRRRARILFGLFSAFLALLTGAVLGALSLYMEGRIERRAIDLSALVAPDWITQDFFEVNPYSRPGTKMNRVNEIIIHYVANPGTTAKQNWNYFNNLKDQKGDKATSASSHFIIGLDGEILQGIPLDEIAYSTSKEKNLDSVSIENCHPGEDGKFTDDTYASLVKLTSWLCWELDLTEKDVIRHYDATGKDCPRYYVAHEDEWNAFLKDVKAALKELNKNGRPDSQKTGTDNSESENLKSDNSDNSKKSTGQNENAGNLETMKAE